MRKSLEGASSMDQVNWSVEGITVRRIWQRCLGGRGNSLGLESLSLTFSDPWVCIK